MSDFIRYEFQGIDDLIKRLDPKKVETAAFSAARRVAQRLRTDITRKVRQVYNVKAGELKIPVIAARADRYAYVLRWSGPVLGLQHFGAPGQRVTLRKGKKRYRGATVAVKKGSGKKVVRDAFVIQKAKKLVVWRDDSEISPRTGRAMVRTKTGPSVPQMVANATVMEDVNKFAAERMPREFDRALTALLAKTGGA